MNKVLLSFAVICVILLSAEAKSKDKELKCMVCSKFSGGMTNNEGKCKDEKDKGVQHTCPSSYNSCRKIVQDDGEIYRGCADKKVEKDTCVENDKDGDKVCHCTGDYCNGSKMNALYHGILLLPIVVTLTTWK